MIARSQKIEQNKVNLEEKELDRKEFVEIAKERREKQQELIKKQKRDEERKWSELHLKQKEESFATPNFQYLYISK